MDLSSLIMGLFLLALFVLPFVLVGRSSKKKKNQLLDRLNELAQQQNCKIAKHDSCSNFIIGTDEKVNFLFFFKKSEEKEIAQSVQLNEVQKCTVLNTVKSLNGKEKGNSGSGKLVLSLLPVKKDSPELLLDFYNENDRVQLSDELILINKWNEIVSQKLRK